ncbi:MAG: hypothetical protein KAV00_15570 [Phycisphaerae bacterium]|nr:hypothetical protein [Phycisphaerae bacterium]
MRRYVSMIMRLLLILCMLTATVSPVYAISFDVHETTVAEVVADPAYYDGTFTRGTIGLVGTLTNISDRARISDEASSIAVDNRQSVLFEGFEDGDTVKMIGAFYYRRTDEDVFVPEGVLHWPMVDAGTVPIQELSYHPASYNGKKVTIIGNLSDVAKFGMGQRIQVESGGKYVKVVYCGGTELEPGVNVKASGIFSVGTLYADTFGKKTALPFGIPGFSGLIAVCGLIFALFVLVGVGRGGRKK